MKWKHYLETTPQFWFSLSYLMLIGWCSSFLCSFTNCLILNSLVFEGRIGDDIWLHSNGTVKTVWLTVLFFLQDLLSPPSESIDNIVASIMKPREIDLRSLSRSSKSDGASNKSRNSLVDFTSPPPDSRILDIPRDPSVVSELSIESVIAESSIFAESLSLSVLDMREQPKVSFFFPHFHDTYISGKIEIEFRNWDPLLNHLVQFNPLTQSQEPPFLLQNCISLKRNQWNLLSAVKVWIGDGKILLLFFPDFAVIFHHSDVIFADFNIIFAALFAFNSFK